jgi:hypothetical protein
MNIIRCINKNMDIGYQSSALHVCASGGSTTEAEEHEPLLARLLTRLFLIVKEQNN